MAAQRSKGDGLSDRALQVCRILVEKARSRQTTTFGELAGLAGMSPNFPPAVVPILKRVAARCHSRGCPPLTALVLKADGSIPSGLCCWLEHYGKPWEQAVEDVFDFDWSGFCPSGPEGVV